MDDQGKTARSFMDATQAIGRPNKAQCATVQCDTKSTVSSHLKYRASEPKAASFQYWNKQQVTEALAAGTVIQGPLRINPKNYRQCFVPYTDNYIDVYIPWRNRALNGDIVAVHLLEQKLSRVIVEDIEGYLRQTHGAECVLTSDFTTLSTGSANDTSHLDYVRLDGFIKEHSDVVNKLRQIFATDSLIPDRFLQPVGVVVDIVEEKHSRLAAGQLVPRTDNNTKYAMFVPNDSRLPRIDIPIKQCPKEFLKRSKDFAEVLYVAKITGWKEGLARAQGTLQHTLGSNKDIEPMTKAILMEYGIEFEDFSAEVLNCLPTKLPWTTPPMEYCNRRDFTKECVFTVDPATARDLDDALSCKQIDHDKYEIGVHIADVSYFIEQGSKLDESAASRATSVYMVQKVIPMLPPLLSEQLCSLNPDEERLVFSVVWHIDSQANITDEWFGRSIIKSCAKLSYQHAQGFIDEPERDWKTDELPPISGGFTVQDIKQRVLTLHMIAKLLRRRRFDAGALRLDQTKLAYTLNKNTGYPTGFYVYELKESNRMIEEYMLLANMAVARKIYTSFPEQAVLRRHPEPQGKQLSDLEIMCQSIGLNIDTTSSHTIQASLAKYVEGDTEEDIGKFQILMQLCTKPMQRALYFCTGALEDESLYRHYALCVPLYTHFTSPIRRYADLMVHRLLAASLGYCDIPHIEARYIEAQAKHCNDKKNGAKDAGILSVEMFFVAFLKECGPMVEKAMVITVLDRAVDVVCIKLGYKKRAYTDKLELKGIPVYNNEGVTPTLTLAWPSLDRHDNAIVTQTLKVFDIVSCLLTPGKDIIHFEATLLHPSHTE